MHKISCFSSLSDQMERSKLYIVLLSELHIHAKFHSRVVVSFNLTLINQILDYIVSSNIKPVTSVHSLIYT